MQKTPLPIRTELKKAASKTLQRWSFHTGSGTQALCNIWEHKGLLSQVQVLPATHGWWEGRGKTHTVVWHGIIWHSNTLFDHLPLLPSSNKLHGPCACLQRTMSDCWNKLLIQSWKCCFLSVWTSSRFHNTTCFKFHQLPPKLLCLDPTVKSMQPLTLCF